MSISGLSNHLCVVVATVISLIVASSTFHQARARPDSYDFTNSRQYIRNLAVSKFREHPHWLPNYTWKPPEKFYGPRKHPSWEVDEVPETTAERKEREEREEWENKMRELSRREREKWKMDNANEQSKPQSSDQILMPSDDDADELAGTLNRENESPQSDRSSKKELLQNGSTKTKEEVHEPFAEAETEWKNDLHNGRWAMSIVKPAAQGFFKNTQKSSQQSISMSQTNEQTALPATFSNGRWGMSVKETPRDLQKEIPGEFPDLGSSDTELRRDPTPVGNEDKGTSGTEEATRLPDIFSNGRSGTKVADMAEREIILSSQLDEGTTVPVSFPSDRWGMNVKEVPKEFLKEISSSANNLESSKNAGKRNGQKVPVENAKVEAATKPPNGFSNGRWGMNVEEPAEQAFFEDAAALFRKPAKDRSIISRSNVLGQSIRSSPSGDETAAPATFPSGRWGMSVKEVPKEFLKDMSRRSQPLGNSGRVWEDRTPAGNIKIHAEQQDGGKTKNALTGTAATKLSNGYPSGRRGMGVGSPPGDYLTEISKLGLARIPGVYRPRTVNQRVDANAMYNPLSRKLTFSTTTRISNAKIFLPPFPSIRKVSTIPRVLTNSRMQRILPNYNIPISPYIVCAKWNFV